MRKLIILPLFVILMLSGCEKAEQINERTNVTENVSEISHEQADFIKLKGNQIEATPVEPINETVNKFEGQLSLALLNNDILSLKSLVKENSRLWIVIEKMIIYCNNEGIKTRLISYEIQKIEAVEKEKKYKVYLKEKLDIKYPKTNFYVYDYYWVMDIEKIDNKYLICDLTRWTKGEPEKKVIKEGTDESKDNSSRRFPKILPQYLKGDKFAMTKSAMEGFRNYIEVDYNNLDIEKRINGFNYAYGDGLFSILADYKNRIETIKERKMIRKIKMQEMIYQEHHDETGLVDVRLTMSNEENGIERQINGSYRVNLMNMGNGVWYIINIENIPFP